MKSKRLIAIGCNSKKTKRENLSEGKIINKKK